jgi:DNA repair exonuclease SbcCD ATPase subunit
MLHLKQLKLVNWGPIEKVTIPFGFGTNAILAPNGTGKSNVLDALQFLITGKLPKKTGWYLRCYGQRDDITKATVEGIFTYLGEDLTVKRTLSLTDKGDPAEGVAPKVSTRGSFKMGEIKLASVSDVVERMQEITGIANSEMAQAVFVEQNQAGSILRARPSDQTKLFEKLGGAEVCAKARSYAVKKLSTVSVLDQSEQIAIYTKRVNEGNAEVVALTDKVNTANAKVQTIDREAAAHTVYAYEQYLSRVSQQATVHADMQSLQTDIDNLERKITQHRMDIDVVAPALESQAQAYEQAKAQRLNAQQGQQIAEEHKRLATVLAGLATEAEGKTPPAPPAAVDTAQMEANIEAWSATLAESNKFLLTFESTGSCPACGSKPENVDDLVARHRQIVDSYTPALQTERHNLQTAQQAVKSYEADTAAYNAWVEGWKRRYEAATASQEALPPAPASVNTEELDATVAEYEAMALRKSTAESQISILETECNSKKLELGGKQALLSDVGEAPPTEEEYNQAKAQVVEYDQASRDLATAQGSLQTRVTALEQEQTTLNSMLEDQARNAKNIKLKEILEGLKTVFHHDAIPKDRVKAYMEGINEKISNYASRLNAPFSMYVDGESLRPMAQFHDRIEPVFQLSGGQFMLAAWSWHLSLYEEHGGNVGFIFMDEPTVALDDTNIKNVSEVVQYLNNYCAESGLQFIMITHEEDLAAGFSHQINLTRN